MRYGLKMDIRERGGVLELGRWGAQNRAIEVARNWAPAVCPRVSDAVSFAAKRLII